MNGWAALAVAVALYLGYGIGVAKHDASRHRWQISWLIGRAGHQETRIRRVEAVLHLAALEEGADPPAPQTLADRARAVWRWLAERTEPQPADPPTPETTPDPEPPTAPIPQVDVVDPWRARFDFSGGDRP